MIHVLHTEWSDGWGGQEIRIINEMLAVQKQGVVVYLACRENSVIKEKALEKGIKVFTLPFKGNTDLLTLIKIIRIIKNYNIDIVNTHSGKDTWVGGIAAKLSGAKFIRTRHLSNRIRTSRLNFINELSDFIFTTGESIREDMIKFNRIKPDKIQSIPTGVDIEKFNPDKYDRTQCRVQYGLNEDDIVIGTVAVLRRFKRHDRFLRMVKYLNDHNPNKKIKVLLVGDGPQRKNLEIMVNDLGLEDKVSMLGHVDNVPELLCALDIFVLTSDSGEGVPQSVMQALLMHTAVIATNAGSTADLYQKDNFMLINKDDEKQLNEACTRMIRDERLRKYYAKKSRDFIAEHYSQAIMTENIIKVYSNLIHED